MRVLQVRAMEAEGRREADTNWEAQEADLARVAGRVGDLFICLLGLLGNLVTDSVPRLLFSSIRLGMMEER